MRAQPTSCEVKVLRRPATIFSSETNLALSELTTAPVGDNLASLQVKDESLNSASCEAKIVFQLSVKLRPKLAHPANLRPKCHAAPAQPSSGVNLASLKAQAQCYTASLTSSNEAKVLYAITISQCEVNTIVLSSPPAVKLKHFVL